VVGSISELTRIIGGFMGEFERYEKCRSMMVCCKTKEQLAVAVRWINLFVAKYGGFSIELAAAVMTVRGVMMERLGVVDSDVVKTSWGCEVTDCIINQ
jgi:hypothetical protein